MSNAIKRHKTQVFFSFASQPHCGFQVLNDGWLLYARQCPRQSVFFVTRRTVCGCIVLYVNYNLYGISFVGAAVFNADDLILSPSGGTCEPVSNSWRSVGEERWSVG